MHRETLRASRKRRRCFGCEDIIEVGEKYWDTAGEGPEGFWYGSLCTWCRDFLLTDNGREYAEGYSAGSLREPKLDEQAERKVAA